MAEANSGFMEKMPTIFPARRLQGHIAAVLLAPAGVPGFQTLPQPGLTLAFEGILGDTHAGFTRKADARTPWYRRGEPIRNVRHLSVVSVEELAQIAAAMGVARVKPEWLGANLVLQGIAHLSFLPRGTRIAFASGAVIAAEGYNPPCSATGRVVEGHCNLPAFTFKKAAGRLRGVVASVERAGQVRSGDGVEVFVGEQWVWGTRTAR